MNVLVLGGNGMAGHLIKDYLTKSTLYRVMYTIRGDSKEQHCFSLDVTNERQTVDLLTYTKPDVVINATGLLNEAASKKTLEAIYVNSLFPQRLSQYGQQYGFRVIQISTDCVFSGIKGNYTEKDVKDGTTVYAQSKSLGEITDQHNVTIRTSIIGPEVKKTGIGLFHWFMHQSGQIPGYRHVYWNGVTTLELAKVIEWLLPRDISGLIHLTGREKLSKMELLKLMKDVFQRENLSIKAEDQPKSDKSLVNTRTDFSYSTPEYKQMLIDLKEWMETHPNEGYSY